MNEMARLPVDKRVRRKRAPAARRPRKPRAHYYAFLSYSHRDEELADWLHRELEDFRVPAALAGKVTANGVVPRRLKPIFRDEDELAAADDLGEEIRGALAASQFLIVLCSPSAATSHWTNAEILAFKRSRPEGCILAAIAAGEPFASAIPGREDEECFPPALREKYDRRGRPTGRKAEPLAADLRGGADERRMGFLKLVAGMLGVGLDDLVQREATQRQRRMAWITGSSLLGMLVAIGLAVTAIQARDAARDQRREAEGLVAFMLGDLKDKLEPIGKLDALDGVGARVLAYYRGQDASELSDEGLMQRSRALSLSAQVAFQQGNLATAVPLYEQAWTGTAEAVRRDPDDPRRLYEHAQNVFWLGELARREGNTRKAEQQYREYKRLSDRMTALEPNNLQWRMEAQYARLNLGIVLLAKRRFHDAAQSFESALSPMRSLTAIEPDNRNYQSEMSNLLGWLADARRDQGRLDDAIAIRRQQIEVLERIVAAGSNDVVFRERLIPAHQALGLLLEMRGLRRNAITQFRLALAHADRLSAIEPANTVWKDLSAGVQLMLAAALGKTRDLAAARSELQSACKAIDIMRSSNAGRSRWQRFNTECRKGLAELALATGQDATAMQFALSAIDSARAERSGDGYADRYRIAAAEMLLGDILKANGQLREAKERWLRGFAELPRAVAERPFEMADRARLLRRLELNSEAATLEARLMSIGFHYEP